MNAPQVLDHPANVADVLDELTAEQGRVQLEGPNGENLVLSALRHEAQAGHLLLRLPGLQANLPAWLLRSPVQASLWLGRVRIDFAVEQAAAALVDGLPALRIAVPQRLHRHQRRESFRVAPLSAHYPRAQLVLGGRLLRLATQDLSAGGVALRWAEGEPPAAGDRLNEVLLELSREQRMSVNLRVEHVQDLDGEAIVGCAFQSLSGQAERTLELHLHNLQRKQRTLG